MSRNCPLAIVRMKLSQLAPPGPNTVVIRAIARLIVDPARERASCSAAISISRICRLRVNRRLFGQRLHARPLTMDRQTAAEHEPRRSAARGGRSDDSCAADVHAVHDANWKAAVRPGTRQVKDDAATGDHARDPQPDR